MKFATVCRQSFHFRVLAYLSHVLALRVALRGLSPLRSLSIGGRRSTSTVSYPLHPSRESEIANEPMSIVARFPSFVRSPSCDYQSSADNRVKMKELRSVCNLGRSYARTTVFRKDEINCARRYSNGGKGNLTFWYFPSSICCFFKLVPRHSLPDVGFSFSFENLSTARDLFSFILSLSLVFWQIRGLVDALNCLRLCVETFFFFTNWLIRAVRFCRRRVPEEKRLRSYKNREAELRCVCVCFICFAAGKPEMSPADSTRSLIVNFFWLSMIKAERGGRT